MLRIRKMKPIRTCICTVILAFLTATSGVVLGCSDSGTAGSLPVNVAERNREYIIGVSFLDQTNPYYSESWRGVRDKAAEYPIRLVMKDPQSDPYQQLEDIEEFIDLNVDAIIIAALSPEIIDPALEQARLKGIKVIAHSTKVTHCDIHLASDEWEMGYVLGKEASRWIAENMNNKADIAILNYPRIPQIENRVKGMLDGLNERSSESNVIIIRSASRPEEGYGAMQEILKEHPDIRVVLGINDGGALGALQAYADTNIDPNTVFVGGIDATPEALAMINQNTAMRCTVDIYPYLTGTLDVYFAMRLLQGEVIPDRYTIPIKLIK